VIKEPKLYVPYVDHQKRCAELEAQNKRLRDALKEAQELTNLICNSDHDTPIRGEIESRALELGHLIIANRLDATGA
jgi:hypothetical protein